MKTIGLLGGMSFESTLTYYQVMNTEVKRRLGGSHSAKILMESFDYHDLEVLLEAHRFHDIAMILGKSAKALKIAGAHMLVIGANTMHIVAKEIAEFSGLEVVHIADAVKQSIMSHGMHRVALFGTSYTMQSSMYPDILKAAGIECLVPAKEEQEEIHRTIYQELIKGIINPISRERFQMIARRMVHDDGIEAVILGCTEIPLLIKDHDLIVPVYDTTTIHAVAAVNQALLTI